jgi:DNA-binding NarL/FixJ family response regulator
MRIVIADDAVVLREGAARLLTEAGFDVVAQAGDADDLLRKVRAHRPDVAIIDVRMPPDNVDDGLRAALTIRDELRDVGILLFSQYVEDRYLDQLLARGAEGVGYLLKDRVADVERLTDAVQRVAARGSVLDPEGRRPNARTPPPRGTAGRPHTPRAPGAGPHGRGTHKPCDRPRALRQ